MSSISSSKVISPTAYARKDYAYITMSADQTTNILNGDPIKFNTLSDSSGNMAFDPATYRVTLRANKTYRMQVGVLAGFSDNTGVVGFDIYNVTTSAQVGTRGYCLAADSASHTQPTSLAFYEITTTVDTIFNIRLSSPKALSKIYSAYSFWEIQELETFSPMVQTYQYAYVSPQFNLSVTGVGVTSFVVVRATGTFYKTSDGKWHLRFNIHATHDLDASFSYRIAGIVGVYGFRQACAFSQATTGSAVYEWCYLEGNSGDISIATSANVGNTQVSGDVELSAKPTGYAIPSDV